MNRPLVLRVLGLVLAASAVFFLLRDAGGDARVSPHNAPSEIPDTIGHGSKSLTSDAPQIKPVPFSQPAEPAAAVEVGPDYATPPDRDSDLHGRVVDPKDAPVAGARVEIRRRTSREFTVLDTDYTLEERVVGETLTNRLGEFRIRVPQARAFDVAVAKTGFAPTTLRDRYAGECVLVKLAPGATYTGHVTRATDGAPVAGAELRGWRMIDHTQIFLGKTDATGAFTFAGVEPVVAMVDVLPTAERTQVRTNVVLTAGAVTTENIVVEAGSTISGQVTDGATHEPIAGAEVGADRVFVRSVRTGADGRYVLPGFGGFGGAGSGEVFARAPGYGTLGKPVGRKPAPAGVLDFVLDFALVKGRTAKGRIVAADGLPVAGAYVAAGANGTVDGQRATDWPSARTGNDGTFVIADMRRDLRHALCVHKPGFGALCCDFPPREAETDVVDLGDVTLAAAGSIAGSVIDEEGHPVPNHRMTLGGMNADRMRLWREKDHPAAAEPLPSTYFQGQNGRSDDLGRFRFTDLAAGTFQLTSLMRTAGEPVPTSVEVRAGSETSGVQFHVFVGRPIKGHVVDSAGVPVAGAAVMASRAAVGGKPAARANSMMTQSDGAFAIEALEGDGFTLDVQIITADASARCDGRLVPGHVTGIAAGDVHVTIVLAKSVPITGRVVDGDGKPVNAAFVSAIDDATGVGAGGARTDADGAFSLDVKAGDTVKLALTPPPNPAAASRRDAATRPRANVEVTGVRAGTVGLVLTLPKSE